MTRYYVFEDLDENGATTSLATKPSEFYDNCIKSGAKIIHEFDEDDYERAMQTYYDLCGYGVYKPMD